MMNDPITAKEPGRKLHPAPLRIMHWVNAFAILIMIGSGWAIYNPQPIFPSIKFPAFLLIGGDPATSFKLNGDGGYGGALQWHFAAMWLVVLNGVAYILYGLVSRRFWRKLLPISPGEVVTEVGKALRFDLKHDDITKYNAVQKLLYIGVILTLILQVTAGLALWKPVQFSGVVWLLGGFQGVRLVHFLGMSAICLFLVIHVSLALIVPRTLVAIVTGGPRISDEPKTRTAKPGPDLTFVPLSGAS